MAVATLGLLLIAGTGAVAYMHSLDSLAELQIDKRYNYPYSRGYEELALQQTDPCNIISDPGNTPIWRSEIGPYGIPRNRHTDRGDYDVITWGNWPGLHHNI